MRESESRRASSHRDRDRDYYSRRHHHSKSSRSPTPSRSRSRRSKKSKSSKKYSRRRRSTSSSSSTSYSSQESRDSSRKSKSHSRTSTNLTSSSTRKRAASSESNSQTATSTATTIVQIPKGIDVLDTKVQKQLEVIEEDTFAPKTFYSTRDREAPEKKPAISSDKVIIDLNSVTVTVPKPLDQSKEPEDVKEQIFHQNFLGDAELRTEKWIRKLYNYRQKYTSE